jgi:hypothetical protein
MYTLEIVKVRKFFQLFQKFGVFSGRTAEVGPSVDTDNDKHYSLTEVQELIKGLSDTDIYRLYRSFGVNACQARAGMSEQDVFQEIAAKALAMERPWPVGVSAQQYFAETGKSIISNSAKRYSRHTSLPEHDISSRADINPVPGFGLAQQGLAPNEPPSCDSLDILINEIFEAFEGDAAADCYLRQKLKESNKAIILKICELSEDDYKNVVARIKYKMRKKHPGGIPWAEITA